MGGETMERLLGVGGGAQMLCKRCAVRRVGGRLDVSQNKEGGERRMVMQR